MGQLILDHVLLIDTDVLICYITYIVHVTFLLTALYDFVTSHFLVQNFLNNRSFILL